MLSEAAANGKLDARADASKHGGDFKDIIQGVNQTLDNVIGPLNMAAEYVDRISKGDIPPEITEEYTGDFNEIKNNLNVCIGAVNALVADANMLSEAGKSGKLRTRADDSKHGGDFQRIIKGVNNTLDAVVGLLDNMPIPAMAIDKDFNIQYLNDTGAKVGGKTGKETEGTKCYDFFNTSDCKTSNCACNKAIQTNNVAESETDAHPAPNVDLEIKYSGIPIRDEDGNPIGAFEVVMDQTDIKNQMRKQEKIAEYNSNEAEKLVNGLGKIAEGDLNINLEANEADEDTKEQKETFEKIIGAICKTRDSINALVQDSKMLSEAAADGKLDTRADASKHGGNFKDIIQGVNQTLDNVIGPLNVAAEYVDRISKGDIPPKIEEEYKGDFNEIKNNLNVCIESLNTLANELGKTIDEQKAGDIEARCDHTKVSGAYSELVTGINQALDTVINPVIEGLDILKNYADGDLSTEMRVLPGKQIVLTNSINSIRNNLQQLVSDVKTLAYDAAEGILDTRTDASKHNGEYKIIVEGINNTLDSVIDPLNEAGRVLSVLADGDLRARMEGNYKGEFDKFKADINKLGDSLEQVIANVVQASETVATSSEQISSNSNVLASSSQEQSSQSEEVASAVEEMARTINENAENSGKAANIAEKNGSIAKDGGEVVNQTVTKMRDIANVVSKSSENINKLGESSQQIGEIISVIDDIADQTNLLALNAAIEAARAGDQGRGFAVVADEVRKLAERTTEATKKIAQMIKDIQSEVQGAVEGMNKGNDEVTNGIELADKAGKSLESVLASSEEVMEMITQIATASEEQSTTSEQISKSVESISKVASDSTRQVTEVAEATEDMTELTRNLLKALKKFVVNASNAQGFNNSGYAGKNDGNGHSGNYKDDNGSLDDSQKEELLGVTEQ